MKLVCPSCGARYEKGKFCPECGSPLSEMTTKKVLFCPSCQTEVPSGKFCPECGTKLEEREIEIGAESIAATPAAEPSTQIIEPSVDPEVEAILAKYRDEFGDLRELNKEEYAIAAEEFEKCSSKGSLDGMCYLAYLYMRGWGVPEDQAHAYNLLCEAERKGSKYAVAFLGIFYWNGIIVEQDELEALRRFEDGYKNTLIPEIAGIIAYYYIEHEVYAKALLYAQESASKGHRYGYKALGDLYLHGFGVEQNEQLAFENYMQAAAQGEETALNQIGWMYQNGRGTDADSEQAFFWYNEAAQKGSDVGMNNLAYCYKDGYGVEQDVEAAAEWFKKAAETGCDNSMLELGKYYQETLFDLEKAKMWLLKAIDLGNTDAMNMLGNVFANSNYPCYDTRKAFEWYEKAANANCLDGMWNLACAYSNGTGCELDMEKAEEWLKKAADAGQTEAVNILNQRETQSDTSFSKNIDNSVEEELKKIELDIVDGTEDMIHNAEEWIRQRKEEGFIHPLLVILQFRLALTYINGDGTSVNIQKFQEWMQNAINGGIEDILSEAEDANLMDELADIFADGQRLGNNNNIFIDTEKGFELYKRSAGLGNSLAMSHVGWCYNYGIGTECNSDKAQQWYQKAMDNGQLLDDWMIKHIDRYFVNSDSISFDNVEVMQSGDSVKVLFNIVFTNQKKSEHTIKYRTIVDNPEWHTKNGKENVASGQTKLIPKNKIEKITQSIYISPGGNLKNGKWITLKTILQIYDNKDNCVGSGVVTYVCKTKSHLLGSDEIRFGYEKK